MANHTLYRFLPVQISTVFYRPLNARACFPKQESYIKLGCGMFLVLRRQTQVTYLKLRNFRRVL